MMTPAPLPNDHSRSLKTSHSRSEILQKIGLVPRPPATPGYLSDRTVTTTTVLLTEPDAMPDLLWAQADKVHPITRLEQLTLEDLIEDALLLGVVSRVSCTGERYEITASGDRYTLTPRQALAFLGGAVEVYRARWRLSAAN